jgi:heme/copper-type cytochrome/quinol oxidase subunit 4
MIADHSSANRDLVGYLIGILLTILVATKWFTIPDGHLWVNVPVLVDFGIFVVLALRTFLKRTPAQRDEMAENMTTLKNIFTYMCLAIAGSCGGIPDDSAIRGPGGAGTDPAGDADDGGAQAIALMEGGAAEPPGDMV